MKKYLIPVVIVCLMAGAVYAGAERLFTTTYVRLLEPGDTGRSVTLGTGALTANRTLSAPDLSGTIMCATCVQVMTNKTVDADSNTISNLEHGAEVDNPTSGVHGVSGDVVGTSDGQTLTNKTIDADSNTVSNLEHGAEVDNPSSGVHGVAGTVVGTSDSQTLTNKSVDADLNTITNIDDGEIKAAAGISRSKLEAGTIGWAAFYNGATGILDEEQYTDKSRGGAGADMSGVTFPSSGTIVTATSVAVFTNKTFDIDGTGNSLSNIANANIKNGAAISRQKLASGTIDHVVINGGDGTMSSEEFLDPVRGGTGGDSSGDTGVAKVTAGTWSADATSGDLGDMDPSGAEDGQAYVYDAGTWVPGASGDSSFKLVKVTTTNLKISEGFYRYNGRTYCSRDGSGTSEVDLSDLSYTTFPLDTNDDYLVYIDTTDSTYQIVNGSNRECYLVADSAVHVTKTQPSAIDSWRYFLIGQFSTDGSGELQTAWDMRPEDAVSWANLNLVNMSDWASYTPTGSWTTNTTYTGKWRRVGDTMHVYVRADLTGAPLPSINLTIDIPSGQAIDTTKFPSIDTDWRLGWCSVNDDTDVSFEGSTSYVDANTFGILYHKEREETNNITWGAPIAVAAPFTFASPDSIECYASFPIVGWTWDTGAIASTLNSETIRVTSAAAQGSCDADYSEISANIDIEFAGIRIEYWDDSGSDLIWSLIADATLLDAAAIKISATNKICIDWGASAFDASDYADIVIGPSPNVTAIPPATTDQNGYFPTHANLTDAKAAELGYKIYTLADGGVLANCSAGGTTAQICTPESGDTVNTAYAIPKKLTDGKWAIFVTVDVILATTSDNPIFELDGVTWVANQAISVRISAADWGKGVVNDASNLLNLNAGTTTTGYLFDFTGISTAKPGWAD